MISPLPPGGPPLGRDLVRFVVIGSERDSIAGRELIARLKDNAFDVDGGFRTIRSLDEVTDVVSRSTSTTRVLLLLSNDAGALFGSAVRLDEALAQRNGSEVSVQGVLLEEARRPDPAIQQLAAWRGAVPPSRLVHDLVQARIDAARPRTPAPDDDHQGWDSSAGSRAIRSAFWLLFSLVALAKSGAGSILPVLAGVGAIVVILACDVTEVRWRMMSTRRQVDPRAGAVGSVLFIVGVTILITAARKSLWFSISGLWIAALGNLIVTFGPQRSPSRRDHSE